MMSSDVFSIFLPVAIVIVMTGLGLTLTLGDFAVVLRSPVAAIAALFCQIVLLPAMCLGLVVLFGVHGLLAVGVMVLVASPGGALANIFSHLAGGDVALNVALTGLNSVLALATMPVVVVGLSTTLFLGSDSTIGLRPDKFLQVFATVLVPVAVGMFVRRRYPGWAARMRGPVKAASLVVLALVITGAIVTAFRALVENLATLGPLVLLLCTLSIAIGYAVPRLLRVNRAQSIASAMEVGIHNGTLAIAIAVSVLGSDIVAVPAALYSALMIVPAAIAAHLLSRTAPAPVPVHV